MVWSNYATSIVMISATSPLAITLTLLALEHSFHIGSIQSQIQQVFILFQTYVSGSYSHPAVYLMILPGSGMMSEIIPCFSRKRIFGYSFVALFPA